MVLLLVLLVIMLGVRIVVILLRVVIVVMHVWVFLVMHLLVLRILRLIHLCLLHVLFHVSILSLTISDGVNHLVKLLLNIHVVEVALPKFEEAVSCED